MIWFCFLVTLLVAINAENESGFKPMTSKSWNEATYLSYIKNMAMYPQVTPMSRQEFEKTAINREGKTFDFGDFAEKFKNFGHNQNSNNAQTQQQNVLSFGNPYNLKSMHSLQSAYNPASFGSNQNFGNAMPNNPLMQFGANQREQSFGGVLTQNHGIFGEVLPPIHVHNNNAPGKFQTTTDTFAPGANSDFLDLVREQQKQHSQINQVVYPSTSYGSPIPGSYPQPPPPTSEQQEEVLKLMKLLLSKIDGQASTTAPTVQINPEYEFKLTLPKHVLSNSAVSNAKGIDQSGSSLLKQFDFGPGAKIISRPVKTVSDYNQNDMFQNFKDEDYFFHSPPTRFEHVRVKPMNFRLPERQPEKFHHHKNAPNRFQNGFEYPSLTHEGYRKPPHKRNHRSRKSRAPGYRFKIRKA